jgi:hypothetical protein
VIPTLAHRLCVRIHGNCSSGTRQTWSLNSSPSLHQQLGCADFGFSQWLCTPSSPEVSLQATAKATASPLEHHPSFDVFDFRILQNSFCPVCTIMAKKVQYRGLKNSDDFVEEEEPYLSHEYGRLKCLKDTFFNLSHQIQWQGKLAALLYIISGMLLFASSRFPTEKQCTRKMSTWCKLNPQPASESLKVTTLEHP